MIIRCDNCSVSLQIDESKVPTGSFTVRCPRCQNMLRAYKKVDGSGSSTVEQLAANKPAPAVEEGAQNFAARESEVQINSALRSLLSALQTEKKSIESVDENEKPRRVLLCLGDKRDIVAKTMTLCTFISGSCELSRVAISYARSDLVPALGFGFPYAVVNRRPSGDRGTVTWLTT